MADFFNTLDESWVEFIKAQKVFFTATAPVDGRINLSPKGMDTFRCLDESTVGYLDLTGSGIETTAHLNENGRMTIMFCSFDQRPTILRLYGRGSVICPGEPDWDIYSDRFPALPGRRSIILMKIESAQKSCGYAVPVMEFKNERQALVKWAQNKGLDGLERYWEDKNQVSVDGLPSGLLTDL